MFLTFPYYPRGNHTAPSLSPFNLQNLISILTPAPDYARSWKKPVVLSCDLSPKSQSLIMLTWLLCLFPTQTSLADGHKFDRDVELLIYYNEVHTPSVAVEMGKPTMEPGIFFLPL